MDPKVAAEIELRLSVEEARQLKAVLAIVRRKAERGPFWANFRSTAESVIGRLP